MLGSETSDEGTRKICTFVRSERFRAPMSRVRFRFVVSHPAISATSPCFRRPCGSSFHSMDAKLGEELHIVVNNICVVTGTLGMQHLCSAVRLWSRRRKARATRPGRTTLAGVFSTPEDAVQHNIQIIHQNLALKLQKRLKKIGTGTGKPKFRRDEGPWQYWKNKPYHFQRFVRFSVAEFDILHGEVCHLMFVKSNAVAQAIAAGPVAALLVLENIIACALDLHRDCPTGAAGKLYMHNSRLLTDNCIYCARDRL